MGRRESYAPGTPCAVDLMTTDVAAAASFYDRVFGWRAEELQPGYTAFRRRDGALVAGAFALGEEQLAAGARPSWVTYIAVADVEATAAKVEGLGGVVLNAPREIPGAGRTATIMDAQGASLALWQAEGFAGAEVVNEVEAWTWNDLTTSEPADAVAFYEGLFGWEIREIPGTGGAVWSIGLDGRGIGNVMQPAPGAPAPAWNVYFGVTSVGATLEHVDVADGERVAGPLDVPAGRFAAALDPLGAAFSVFEGQFDD
jgi:predicted enzyme related to lactoylglutathione lyase